MPAQMRHIRAVMRQGMIQDTSGGVNRSLADRLSQAAQSPPLVPQIQPTAPTSKSVSCIASPSDERMLAELEQFDRQCLHAYIASSISAEHAPEFEDEAECTLFQQEAAARRKLDAARREAEALLDADTEQERLLQAAAQNAMAEQEACCQQLHAAAELMSKPHKLAQMTLEELNLLQGAAQRFLSICNDVRDHLHEQEALKHQQEKLQMVKALRAAEALAEKRSALCVELRQEKVHLEDRLETEADKHKCCICMTKQRDALLLPCMHMDYCVTCMNKHMQTSAACPLCRAPIRGILPTLLAQ